MLKTITKRFNNIEVINESEGFASVEIFGNGYEVDGIIIEEVQGAMGTDYKVCTMKETFYYTTLDKAINKIVELFNNESVIVIEVTDNKDRAFKNVIANLVMDDSNGDWEEIQNITELKNILKFYIDEYSDDEDIFNFYSNQLNMLT